MLLKAKVFSNYRLSATPIFQSSFKLYSTQSGKKVAVILSGCGVQDGSEIHEAVSILIGVSMSGATYKCFAPKQAQHHVVNHA